MSMNSGGVSISFKWCVKGKQRTVVFLTENFGESYHVLYAPVPVSGLECECSIESACRILVGYRR